jgi:hypothetical protein
MCPTCVNCLATDSAYLTYCHNLRWQCYYKPLTGVHVLTIYVLTHTDGSDWRSRSRCMPGTGRCWTRSCPPTPHAHTPNDQNSSYAIHFVSCDCACCPMQTTMHALCRRIVIRAPLPAISNIRGFITVS